VGFGVVCLQLPQLFANFKAQSADGLSMAFLIVWLLGDLTNLLGLCHHFASFFLVFFFFFLWGSAMLLAA
jgi:solute carrier family 66 (lysosomal lysine-arginine transporter), member 1